MVYGSTPTPTPNQYNFWILNFCHSFFCPMYYANNIFLVIICCSNFEVLFNHFAAYFDLDRSCWYFKVVLWNFTWVVNSTFFLSWTTVGKYAYICQSCQIICKCFFYFEYNLHIEKETNLEKKWFQALSTLSAHIVLIYYYCSSTNLVTTYQTNM